MKYPIYRGARAEILSRLGEMSELSDLLTRRPDRRTHYLSIVFRLPGDIRNKLTVCATNWTKDWPKRRYIVQATDSVHVTLVGSDRIVKGSSISQSLLDSSMSIRDYLKEQKETIITLGKAEIGARGINVAIIPSDSMKAIVQELHRLASVPETQEVNNRSISLVRYLIPDRNDKAIITWLTKELDSLANKAEQPGNEEADFAQDIHIKELLLVQLDKVAEYFNVIQRFNLS